MSMVVQINIEVKRLAILERALARTGYRLHEATITNKRGLHLCSVRRRGGSFILTSEATDYRARHEIERKLNRIKQLYAVEEVIETAQQNGWTALGRSDEKVQVHDLTDVHAHGLRRVHVLGRGLPGQTQPGIGDDQINGRQTNHRHDQD